MLKIISAIVIALFSISYIGSYLVVINNPSLTAYSTLFFISLFFTPVVYAASDNSVNIRDLLSAKNGIQTYWLSIIAWYGLMIITSLILAKYGNEYKEGITLPSIILFLFITWKLLPNIASTNEKSYSYYIRSGYLAIAFFALGQVMDGDTSSIGDIALHVVLALLLALIMGFILFPPLLKYAKNLIPSKNVDANPESIGVVFGSLIFIYLTLIIFTLLIGKLELYVVDLLTPTGVVIIGSLIAVIVGYQTMNLIGRLFATIFTTNKGTIKVIANSIIIVLITFSAFIKVTHFDKNLNLLNTTQEKVGSLVQKIET